MRILFVFIQFLPNVGGTELPMYYYAKELVRKGHHVMVFTANAVRLKPSNLKEKESIDGILVRRFRFFPVPYNLFFFAPSLISNLLSVKVNVIHVFSWIPSFFILLPCFIAKIRKIPLVLYPQCYPERFGYYPSIVKRIIGIFMDRIIGPRIMKRANYVIALTNREAEFYEKNKVKNVEIIREPIFLKAHPQRREILKFRKKYRIQENDIVLLSVGRIVKYKGIHTLIKSLPEVLKYIHNVKLLVVGEDWGFLSECVKLSNELSCERNVNFTGLVSDEELSCAYEVADVIVIPSFFEGYGRVVLEAWAHHKPVIATNTVGLAELVSSQRGMVVRAEDSSDLAHAIIKLVSDPDLAKSLGKSGHQVLQEEFTWEIAVKKLENIYNLLNK